MCLGSQIFFSEFTSVRTIGLHLKISNLYLKTSFESVHQSSLRLMFWMLSVIYYCTDAREKCNLCALVVK